MEAGFFISVAAMALETLLFIATIVCVAVQALRGKTAWSRRLWWPVVISAPAGVAAFSLSVHYVFNNPLDPSWVVFVALSALLPLLLAAVVGSTLRRQLKQ